MWLLWYLQVLLTTALSGARSVAELALLQAKYGMNSNSGGCVKGRAKEIMDLEHWGCCNDVMFYFSECRYHRVLYCVGSLCLVPLCCFATRHYSA